LQAGCSAVRNAVLDIYKDVSHCCAYTCWVFQEDAVCGFDFLLQAGSVDVGSAASDSLWQGELL
jgi:hypothetical protein